MLKKKIDRTSYKEILPMLFAGSPDWTIFATFVWVMKRRKYTINWKKLLGSVKKENI